MAIHSSTAPAISLSVHDGHPIRRRLVPVAAREALPANTRDDDHDLKLFALSFTAFFICIYTLIC